MVVSSCRLVRWLDATVLYHQARCLAILEHLPILIYQIP